MRKPVFQMAGPVESPPTNDDQQQIISYEDLTDKLCEDYSKFLHIDATRQKAEFYENIEEMLIKLDEFCGLVDMIRSDTNLCLKKTVPEIKAKCVEMQNVFEKIDKLEAFVAIIKQNVSAMEEQVGRAEDEMGSGSLSGLKKMFSSLVSPKKVVPKKATSYTRPKIFSSKDYFTPKENPTKRESSPSSVTMDTASSSSSS